MSSRACTLWQRATGGHHPERLFPVLALNIMAQDLSKTPVVADISEIQDEPNKDGSGKGQWAAWKVCGVLPLYIAHDIHPNSGDTMRWL
jgi:hypothetical protein